MYLVPPEVQLVKKERSVDNRAEGNGSSMHTTAPENGAPRSVKQQKQETEQPKDTRPVRSSDSGSPPKRVQRIRLNPPNKPGSSHDPSMAVTSGVEMQECMQKNSDDSTRIS